MTQTIINIHGHKVASGTGDYGNRYAFVVGHTGGGSFRSERYPTASVERLTRMAVEQADACAKLTDPSLVHRMHHAHSLALCSVITYANNYRCPGPTRCSSCERPVAHDGDTCDSCVDRLAAVRMEVA